MNIHDATIRNAAIIELQEKLLAAQEAQSTLTERIRELEEQMTTFETWDADKQEYERTTLPSDSTVYSIDPEIQGAKSAHYICANCYEHHKRSILQPTQTSIASSAMGIPRKYHCPECKAEFLA